MWKILGYLSPFLLAIIGYLYNRKIVMEKQVSDAKRNNYKMFITIYLKSIDTIRKSDSKELPHSVSEEMIKDMRQFAADLILFGTPSLIQTYNDFMRYASSGQRETLEIVRHLDRIIKGMRSDLGLSNYGLREFDVLQPFLKENTKDVFSIGGK